MSPSQRCDNIASSVNVIKRRKEHMKKKPMIIITVAILAVATLIIVLLLVNRELELPELKTENVSSVYCETSDNEKIDLDIEEFLGYYNQIYDLRNNEEGAGTTPTSMIIIELKEGKEIRIYNSGDQFEVNFSDDDGENRQYWGKQQQIANMLYHGLYQLK